MAGGSGKGRHRKIPARSKSRHTVKDAIVDFTQSSDLLSDELTALSAIFQEDMKVVSQNPFVELIINLRPYAVDEADVEFIAAELSVRFSPGYPHKPPKIQIIPKEGLLTDQLRNLHVMLVEQASSIAREGRAMVFDLTETAQEFLSDQIQSDSSHLRHTHESVSYVPGVAFEDCWTEAETSGTEVFPDGPGSEDCVFIDLFNDLWGEGDTHWNGNLSSVLSRISDDEQPALGNMKKSKPWGDGSGDQQSITVTHMNKTLKDLEAVPEKKFVVSKGSQRSARILPPVQEEIENKELETLFGLLNCQSFCVSDLQQVISALGHGKHSIKPPLVPDDSLRDGNANAANFADDVSFSYTDVQSTKKDIILGYLLRLACSPKGPFPQALPILASELRKMGIMPSWIHDLATNHPRLFDATFRWMFLPDKNMISDCEPSTHPAIDHFWSANPDLLGGNSTSSVESSRYLSDFEELYLLGRGGFGHVVLCENKLDGRRYAMKKIRLKDKDSLVNEKILREVATLSRLQHNHVVRYYQAWMEKGMGRVGRRFNDGIEDSENSASLFGNGSTSTTPNYSANEEEPTSVQATYLYIQMEYCPRTLREIFDKYTVPIEKEKTWRIFRQIVEGLAHIHGQGIIHRDLTPSNVFFDARGDIKIGDFGLAKFTNLEQMDREPAAGEVSLSSFEGTGQVGTYFYTAPEIDQGLPHIDVKVDMYSLGVVLFELWYSFSTAMERFVVLNDLKNKSTVPSAWATEFPEQATLVHSLMAHNPADRPTAAQVLRSELLPPRMEGEALKDILRTIQKSDDTSIYDQVVAAIFDDERIAAKAEHLDGDFAKLKRREKFFSSMHLVQSLDHLLESVKDVFMRHGAQHLESVHISVVDDPHTLNRQAVKLLDPSGNMLVLRYETRIPFSRWVALNQRISFKRYEITRVYRRGIVDNAPREYFQGDFDIIGGAKPLAEAEAVKVAVEIANKFPAWDACKVFVNHRKLLRAIWTWTGVKSEDQQKVAQLLAVMGGVTPRSSARKALWPFIRRQLLQGLQIGEAVVDRLQIVERRWSGAGSEALPRLRGALPQGSVASAAIDELSILLRYLRLWQLEKTVVIDCLMPATEEYFNGVFFQVYVQRAGISGRNTPPPVSIGVGGRYDQLLEQFWSSSAAHPSPGAVGLSIALQRLMDGATPERKIEAVTDVLVCSRGGGGLLAERMEVVQDLWAANIKAEFVSSEAPSLKEQYEYAHQHGIKWLIIISEAALSLAGTVKVRHLEHKKEEDIPRIDLVKYFSDLASGVRKRGLLTRYASSS